MAIDTSIYGMIAQPKIKTPAEFQAEALTLRNLGMENDLRQQQIASARALEQQRIADLQADQDFANGLRSGATEQELYATNPKAAAVYFKGQRENQKLESEAETQKRLAETARIEGEGKKIVNQQNEYKLQRDKLSDLYNRLSQIKDEGTYYNVINQAFDDEILDLQQAHELADHPFNPEEIKGLSTKMLTEMQRLDLKSKLFDLTSKQEKQPLEVAKLTNEVKTGTPDPVTGLTKAQTAQYAPKPGVDVPLPPEVEAQRKRLYAAGRAPSAPVSAPGSGNTATKNLTGNDYLATLDPSMAGEVRAIAEGRATAPTANARTGRAQQIRAALFQYDPTFNDQRAQVRKAFTTGPDGRNVGALNTAIVHLDRLGGVAEAMKNGSFTPQNEMFNYLKDKFGAQSVTNFSLLKDAVAGEMAAAMKGNATDIEIEKMGRAIRSSNSPAQMEGVVKEGMSLLTDKVNTYQERFRAVAPDDTTYDVLLPSARKALQKHGVARPSASGGGRPTIKILKVE